MLLRRKCCCNVQTCGDCEGCASPIFIEVQQTIVGVNLSGTFPALVRWSASDLRLTRGSGCTYDPTPGTGTIVADYSTDGGDHWTEGIPVLSGWDIACITQYCDETPAAAFFDVRVNVTILDEFGGPLIPSALRFHWRISGVACPDGHTGRFVGMEDGSVSCDIPTNPITLVSGDDYQVTSSGIVEVTS